MTDIPLRLDCISVAHGDATAVHDLSLDVLHGEIIAVLGNNGAGKSTLLRAVARVLPLASGSIELWGKNFNRRAAYEVARSGVSLVREGAPVFSHLSVIDHLQLGATLAKLRGFEPAAVELVWQRFPMLEAKAQSPAGLLSGGQRQMLAIGSALVSRPRLLVLDEPSAGLAPQMAATVFAAIREMSTEGLAVLIAEQNPDWVAGFATRSCIMESGHLKLEGAADDLTGNWK